MSFQLSDIYQGTRKKFKDAGLDEADIEAKALITGLFDLPTLEILANPNLVLSKEQVDLLNSAISDRLKGKPVYRILGWREFYGLKFKLSEETLEPRADTEILVDAIIPIARQKLDEKGDCRLLDLGTGTGAIALSILNKVDGLSAMGVDLSKDALSTAVENAKNLGLADRFDTIYSSWTKELDQQFDIIVSNPPYISQEDLKTLSIEVQNHDPVLALDGGVDGLDAYRKLAMEVLGVLKSDGFVGLEIGYGQENAVIEMFEKQGFELVSMVEDLAGINRALIFTAN